VLCEGAEKNTPHFPFLILAQPKHLVNALTCTDFLFLADSSIKI